MRRDNMGAIEKHRGRRRVTRIVAVTVTKGPAEDGKGAGRKVERKEWRASKSIKYIYCIQ